ncbi:nucleoside monophosphate kinase [Candidatus Kaiserbacteria bacterium]|nr:nucleoside monophosphate kinase [Candidatus Kaiserbacteria bacterium]
MGTPTIFFIGKPGCGKGTQAKLLSQKTGWTVFSSGKLFREIAEEDTPVGRKVKTENDAGELQPHWFAMYLYLKSLFSIPDDRGIIFDGFNRKIPEAELVIDSLAWLGRQGIIVNIRVSDKEVRRRLDLRKEIESRADDAVVDERLKEYYEYTEPAIELFRTSCMLIEVNGEQTPEEIAADINAALKIA